MKRRIIREKIKKENTNIMCVWVEDADKLDISSNELNVVYCNTAIRTYLLKNSLSLGLAGVKGQGKTFLIKVKRKQISEDNSIICLPFEKMVDTVDSCITINESLNKYLKDYDNWVKLWKFSISTTILSCKDIQMYSNISGLKHATKSFIATISNPRSEPSAVFNTLLKLDIKDLRCILDDTDILFNTLKGIRKGICVFFDKIDQGFSGFAKRFNDNSSMPKKSRNASYWQYAQYALAECSYDIYTNANSHIKIYYTMRQEACIDCAYLNKDKVRNINSYITILKYSKYDLREMYRLYINNEHKKNLIHSDIRHERPSEAFVGIEEIPHGYVNSQKENVFDYIYRHTFKRPYDIMLICRALYMADVSKSEDGLRNIRQIVNQKSNDLLSMYLQELSIFLPFEPELISYLSKMFTGNVLNSDLLKDICSIFDLYKPSKGIWKCNKNCSSCSNPYPFSILYNIGLIGCIKQHATDRNSMIVFENIGNSILDLKSQILPISKYYYLHPALSNSARDKRNLLGLNYNTCDCVIIGDGCEIDSSLNKALSRNVNKNANMFKKEKVFISSTVKDLKKERKSAHRTIKLRGLYPVMCDYEIDTRNAQKVHSHDHCIDELQKCNSLLFIIGENYGGKYVGDRYIKEKQELIELSEGRIKSPSISLMEYYVARKKKIKCFVFMSKKHEEACLSKTIDENIIKEVNFINHFSPANGKIQGNWITYYGGIEDFNKKLNSCKFG